MVLIFFCCVGLASKDNVVGERCFADAAMLEDSDCIGSCKDLPLR